MTASALLLVVAAAVCHATWNLLNKKASHVGPVFVFAYGLCSVVVYLPWVLWILIYQEQNWSVAAVGCIVLSGFLHLAYSLCLQRGYQVADLSVVYPVARGVGPLLSTFGALTFMHEPASIKGVGGMLMVVLGVLLIATQGHVRRLFKPESIVGVKWGAVIGGLIAVYTLVDAYGVKTLLVAPVLFDWATCLTKTLVMLPHTGRNPKEALAKMRGHWMLAWSIGILSPLGYILVLYALQNGAAVSLVAPAREMSMLLVTLAGLYLLREPVGKGRLIGCCAIAAGVVLLSQG